MKTNLLLQELIHAQKMGYIVKLEMIMEDHFGKINYDAESSSFNTEWVKKLSGNELDTLKVAKNLKNFPKFKAIHIVFAETVDAKQITQISRHITKRYNCVSKMYNNFPHKLDITGF